MRIPKMVSLDEETAAIAADMENFSGFVREALRNEDHRRAIERVEESQAIINHLRNVHAVRQEKILDAFNRRSWSELKQMLILWGWI
jgi:hypothetical protein